MVEYLNNNSGFNQWNANKNATEKPKRGGFFAWAIVFFASWWLLSSWLNPQSKNTAPVSEPGEIEVVDLSSVPTSELSNDKISATVQGLRIDDIKLHYENDETINLVADDTGFIEVGFTAAGTNAPNVKTVWKKSGDSATWRNSDGVSFARNIKVDNYLITVTDEIKNKSGRSISVAPYVKLNRENNIKSAAGIYTGSVAYTQSKLDHNDWNSFKKKSYDYTTASGSAFAGFVDQYWETIASIDATDQNIHIQKNGDLYSADIKAGYVEIPSGDTKTITTNLYVGPRDSRILSSVNSVIPGISKTVDYGWFWFLAQPMLWALNGLNAFVGNYGIAIILFTILVRLLMWPLTRKSYTSMMDMQKLQPEMQRIQKLYANDKQRQQIEIARLYQTHKTSPMSGCLPMLIQLPIFFALYKALLISSQMRNAHFLWMSDLSAMDPYFILPILMGTTMWLQQYLQSPKNKNTDKNDTAAQTARAMKWMPIFFTIMFAWMPAGLVLYWTISNVFGIGQMYLIKRSVKK